MQIIPSPNGGIGIHAKIAAVQEQVSAIPRDTAKIEGDRANYRYSFIPEDGLMEFLRPKLVEAGVATYVSSRILSTDGKIVQVEASALFVDTGDGSAVQVEAAAQAGDKGDKAVAKAITSATRYLLWKTFLVPNEDPGANPEAAYDPEREARLSEDGDGYGRDPAPISYTEDEANALWRDVRALAQTKGRLDTFDQAVATWLAKYPTAKIPHPDWLLKNRTALSELPTPELPADPATPATPPPAPAPAAPQPTPAPAQATPPPTPPAPQNGLQDVTTPQAADQIRNLVSELAGLAPGQDWQARANARCMEWFAKPDTDHLTDQEAATLTQRLTQTKISLAAPTTQGV